MEIKYSIQGAFIYTTMALFILALIACVLRRKKIGLYLYFAGFIVSLASFMYRGLDVGHVPFQNLFEVFLGLGMLIYPITVFCRRFFKIESERSDLFLAVILLFPAAFVFDAQPQQLPPALQSWLFAPHVAVYMLSYIIMAKAAVLAGCQLTNKKVGPSLTSYDKGIYHLICMGFPFMTLGLVLGSIWGKYAWGHYWGWDPKELWSLATWLAYLGYFHYRYMTGRKYPKIESIWAILGLIFIIITLLWVNLSKIFAGLHNYAV